MNAQQLVKKEAAILVKDSEAMQQLVPALLELARNEPAKERMKQQMAALTITDADVRVAKDILEQLQTN